MHLAHFCTLEYQPLHNKMGACIQFEALYFLDVHVFGGFEGDYNHHL